HDANRPDSVSPCMSQSSPTGVHRQPSCCAKATANTARPRSEPSRISPTGRPNASSSCAPCCAARSCFPPPMLLRSSDLFPMATPLARRHLKNGALLLYDVTSTYLEGRCCELARHGHSRDHRRDRAQLVIGLLCAADGCPVAVEVFEGNTADPMTLSSQIDKLKQRFKLRRVVMVGDRGLLTSARIEQTLRPAGLDWITALRAPAIKQLAAAGGPLQPSLFDDRDMAEITSPDYPGERLVVCKNPLLAEERARKRAELLAVTENELARIAARVQRARNPLRGAAAIGQAIGAVLGRRHMAKHFQISITDEAFSFARDPVSIAAEAALDGIYVIRTNL